MGFEGVLDVLEVIGVFEKSFDLISHCRMDSGETFCNLMFHVVEIFGP